MPRLRHYDNLGTARFVTFSCYHRYQLLKQLKFKEIFIENLKLILEKHEIKIFGYVLMPEHVHLVLLPPDNTRFGLVIAELKARSAYYSIEFIKRYAPDKLNKILLKQGKHAFWQKRCYDHNCRTVETTIEKINYCHKNPVVRGLLPSPEDWIWSSYNWYNGRRDVPINMDDLYKDDIETRGWVTRTDIETHPAWTGWATRRPTLEAMDLRHKHFDT